MKQGRDSFQSMVLVLTLICAGAGLALGAAYRATRNKIDAQFVRERMAALQIVLPEANKEGFQEIKTDKSAFATDGRYYEAYDKPLSEPSRKLVGYALEAAGTGYSSTIRVTIGVDPKGEFIRGIKITFQQETPGLGASSEAIQTEGTLWDALRGKLKHAAEPEPWFQAQFRGKQYERFVKVGNKYENIQGLTGATITTNAVTDAVVEAVKEFREKVLRTGARGE